MYSIFLRELREGTGVIQALKSVVSYCTVLVHYWLFYRVGALLVI
jgi:hypothetical protein